MRLHGEHTRRHARPFRTLLEKENFPRHQIGESLLPLVPHGICGMLGCAEDVHNAGFVKKYGGVFRWGQSAEPWSFSFGDAEELEKAGVDPDERLGEGVLRAIDQVDIAMKARKDQVLYGLGEPAGNPDPEGSLVPTADGYRWTTR